MDIAVAEHLDHFYREGKQQKQVLFDINLKVSSGEVVILTGESGSGKTTLLTLIGCLRAVRHGSLNLLGCELNNASEARMTRLRSQIGYIFQHFNLFEFMTVAQNVQSSLAAGSRYARDRAREKTQAILDAVGLGDRLKAYPRELSGGQKQRVAIARALVHEPQLILADEPTAALDSKTGREIVQLIQDLAKRQGSAVLLVTHDRRILDVADRIVRINDGKLITAYQEQLSLALPTLDERQLPALVNHLATQYYQPGEVVIEEGDRADTFYIIIEGKFEAVKIASDGSETVLGQMGRNDYFGEIGLFDPQARRSATVRAVGEKAATVVAIDRATFSKLVGDSELTYAAISHQIRKRLTCDLANDVI